MIKIIQSLKEMKDKEIIDDYAIGGATALIYYFEPIQTMDVDVFILIQSKGLLTNLNPIYEFFRERGGIVKNEYIVINNTPVQFLIPYNSLIESALENAVNVDYGDTKVKIFTLEFLMAIMVQTSRAKDKGRLEEIMRAEITFNEKLFLSILNEYTLEEKWIKIKSGFEI